MAENSTPTDALHDEPTPEVERWQLIVRPLGEVALLADSDQEATLKDDPRLRALDLLSRGRSVLAAHLGMPFEDLTRDRIDEELGGIVQHYGAQTIPQAFCTAVDVGDLLVPVLEQTSNRDYERHTIIILRCIAGGQTREETRATLDLTPELFDRVCSRARAQLGAEPSFLSFARWAYELGLRKAPTKKQSVPPVPPVPPVPRVRVYGFSLPDRESPQLNDDAVDAIDSRSIGLSNEETGRKQGTDEDGIKALLKRPFRQLEARDAVEAFTKTLVLGRIAIEAQPMIKKALSKGETAVLILVAQGLANKDIAAKLFLSEHTVKSRMRKALQKLGAKSRVHAVRRMFEIGIFRVDTSPQTPAQTA